MKKLTDRNRLHLLSDAEKNPQDLLTRKKFWRLDFWPHYLRLCEDTLSADPKAGLLLSQPAPHLAAILCKSHPTEVNAADLMILAFSQVGGAYRRNEDLLTAEATFAEAGKHTASASPLVLAQYLERFARLRVVQGDPECFSLIDEALGIYKRGNLVDRHGIGVCLVCRGMAHIQFGQPARSFDDWTAALSHVEMTIDPKPWYAAVHNLAIWAVEYGTDEQIRIARTNLTPASRLLKSFYSRKFAKLKFRWVAALLDGRLGAEGHAEFEFLEVRDGLVALALPLETGWLSTDLARLYLKQGRYKDLELLRETTFAIFRGLDAEDKVKEAMDLWRDAETVDDDLLKRIRESLYKEAKPIPLGIAA